MTHQFREAWLAAAVEGLTPLFADKGYSVPDGVRVSVGFPGGRGPKTGVIGQCWNAAAASDKRHQIFVHPMLVDPAEIIGVLTHELAHAIDDCEHGHKGPFVKIIRAMGLTGKPTCATGFEEAVLADVVQPLVSSLGAYPHGALGGGDDEGGPEGEKKQSTRMLKLEASCCGYLVRTTRKWLEQGLPFCPCGNQMEEAA